MPLTAGGILPRQGEHTQVRYNQGIDPRIVQKLQPSREAVHLPAARHGIDCHMDAHALLMGEAHRPGQLLRGKIPRKGAHPKAFPRQVDRIRAIQHRHPQPLHVPGG